MFKDNRYINAGTNEFYRYGHKAVEKVKAAMTPNAAGYYNIPADGGKYWTFGTSNGKYGEYAKLEGTFFSVNKAGKIWAKVGTDKADAFLAAMEKLIEAMNTRNAERFADEDDEDEE